MKILRTALLILIGFGAGIVVVYFILIYMFAKGGM